MRKEILPAFSKPKTRICSKIRLAATTVSGYLANISNPEVKRLAKKIPTLAREAIPDAYEGIKMGVPCYSINRKYIALIGDYTNHVNLYFPQGVKLSSEL